MEIRDDHFLWELNYITAHLNDAESDKGVQCEQVLSCLSEIVEF
jgi:hypothetical protein